MCSFITLEKEQVTTMVRYELKKVFGSVGSKIALLLYAGVVVLSCWLTATGVLNLEVKWVNEQGESEYGLSAIQKRRDAQKEWEGWLNEEKLNQVAQEKSEDQRNTPVSFQ